MHEVLIGDNRLTMPTLPAGCAHVCVTSPPYFGLRSYLPADHADKSLELGSEATPEIYIEQQLAVFHEVRRVLRDDGLLFVNLGDSYDAGTSTGRKGCLTSDVGWHSEGIGNRVTTEGTKTGDLLGMPWRFALAMRDDGWWLRDCIIWHKPSPMPSSQNGVRWTRCMVKTGRKAVDWTVTPKGWDVGKGAHDEVANGNYRQNGEREQTVAVFEPCPGCDKCRAHDGYVLRRGRFRTTTSHEFIFMFAKSKGYFTDAEACKEAVSGNAHPRGDGLNPKTNGAIVGVEKQNESFSVAINGLVETRIPRSVWKISPEPYKKAHFATFPSALPKRCIEMATSPRGCCPACGAQYAPVVESERVATRPGTNHKIKLHPENQHGSQTIIANMDPQRHVSRTNVLDYWPTCDCKAGDPVPCVVLDCYGGSGTTAQAAQAIGRDWIICELNEAYVDQERINTPPRWALPAKAKRPKPAPAVADSFPLFANLETP